MRKVFIAAAAALLAAACGPTEEPMPKDDPWKGKLTAEEYRVLRQKGTEAPFTGRYDRHFAPGIYRCGACGQDLFSSETKYDAECGWPSFWDALPGAVKVVEGAEVVCSRCGSHLGHRFDDGPPPTRQRW